MIAKTLLRQAQGSKVFVVIVRGGGGAGAAGVRFTQAPRHERCGTVAVYEDLYGNRWDLVKPS